MTGKNKVRFLYVDFCSSAQEFGLMKSFSTAGYSNVPIKTVSLERKLPLLFFTKANQCLLYLYCFLASILLACFALLNFLLSFSYFSYVFRKILVSINTSQRTYTFDTGMKIQLQTKIVTNSSTDVETGLVAVDYLRKATSPDLTICSELIAQHWISQFFIQGVSKKMYSLLA